MKMNLTYMYETLISHMELKQFTCEILFSYVNLHVNFLKGNIPDHKEAEQKRESLQISRYSIAWYKL